MAEQKRLVSTTGEAADDAVSDILYVMMLNVEEAFIYAGAKPGEDYTYNDLMEFALKLYQKDGPTEDVAYSKPVN